MVCRVHEHLGHNIVEDEEREQGRREKFRLLVERLEHRKGCISKFVSFIEEEQKKTISGINEIRQKIESIRDAAIKRINENSDSLISECEELERGILDKQGDIKRKSSSYVASVESAGELVTKGITSQLDGDALVAHETLCQELEKLLEEFKTDYPKVRNLTRCAEGKQFKPTNVEEIPALGTFEQRNGWVLGGQTELTKKDSMNGLAATLDGRMAVGSRFRGVEIFSADGKLQQRVLNDTEIGAGGLHSLSDGRFIVRSHNTIALYTPEWKKLDISFETLGSDEGNWGGLTADGDDHIYVGYYNVDKIQVFTAAGGKTVREIQCGDIQTLQTCALKLGRKILTMDSHSIKVFNERGIVNSHITHSNKFPYPTVRHDNSVIIAWVRHEEGLIDVEQYTDELKHIKTLITDFKIEKEKRNWYFLRELLTGELAFCTPDKLYILHKFVPLSEIAEL